MDLPLILAIVAVAISCGAAIASANAWRSCERAREAAPAAQLRELRALAEETRLDLDDLHERFQRRRDRENLANARSKHEERAQRKQTAEEEAAAILAANVGNAQQLQKAPSENSAGLTKAQLRARFLLDAPAQPGGRAN